MRIEEKVQCNNFFTGGKRIITLYYFFYRQVVT